MTHTTGWRWLAVSGVVVIRFPAVQKGQYVAVLLKGKSR